MTPLQHGRAVVFMEERFVRLPDGRFVSPGGFGNEFWQRYLDVFGDLTVAARVADKPHEHGALIDDPRVHFHALPNFIGPAGFWPVAHRVLRQINAAIRDGDHFMLRLPGLIGAIAGHQLARQRKPFAVHLVGDPEQVFATGIGGAMAPVLRVGFARSTRYLCHRAAAVSYVTKNALQAKYPASAQAYRASFSDITIGPQHLREAPRPMRPLIDGRCRLLAVGSLEQRYKGFDVLLRAMAILRDHGFSVTARLAGDGRYRSEIERLAKTLALEDAATFLGRVSREQVFEELDAADIFVLPSRTEGLARALIEAMARGAPAIASDVGGIPELLEPGVLVRPDDPAALADAIRNLAQDPARMARQSARNLTVARDYRLEVITQRRRDYYEAVRRLGQDTASIT